MTEPTSQTPIATFDLTVLDAPDPRALAEFYCAILGWEIQDPSDWQEGDGSDWVTIRGAGGGGGIAFQLAPDHVPPTWPDNSIPQQFHLDLNVPDLDVGEQQVIALGARTTGLPEARSGFRVFLDPAGHPFCLCKE
ncbi:putative enzyme related to lactoylglutathione lyase [Nakamurella sp. UYEF19]|uniref:VOC family protein n=1 Tax=Nakamurella sp. UYEF19 TaxID=1756392 RepID=UPI003396D654